MMIEDASGVDMDTPLTDVDLTPEKPEKVKEGGQLFHCDHFDTEIVHKIAQLLIPGLATACVDNTTGDLFKGPASVAVEIRKEMVDYLTQRSENFVAETVILENDDPDAQMSDHPYDIISDFVDDFATSKRNLFSRVSGWLLSERREDKIDDFVQEMEMNAFWTTDRREVIAQTLLKNVDFRNTFHCQLRFDTEEELSEHVLQCGFRSMDCTNRGCSSKICAADFEKHDSICPYKILRCEQKCKDYIMRREMDRHCITVCPMKVVNCPFYSVGCEASVAYSLIEKHRLENLHNHVLYILQVIHKEVAVEDLEKRVGQLEKSTDLDHLAEARDVRSLTRLVKDLESNLGPIEVDLTNKVAEDSTETSKLVENPPEARQT